MIYAKASVARYLNLHVYGSVICFVHLIFVDF